MNVKDVHVEIRTAREKFPSFDAVLCEDDGLISVRGEFELTYDGKKIRIKRKEPLEYELVFEQGLHSTRRISTPYGDTEMSYEVLKVGFEKSERKYVFRIAYKKQGDDGCELYTVTATEIQGVRK